MRLQADVVFTGGRAVSDRVVTIMDGRITAVASASDGDASSSDVIRLPGKALLPGTVNAGITRITEMKALGLLIGLGTDGGCTNNRLSVFEEMRMAALLQKVRHLDGTRLPAEQAFAMGTVDGGRLLGLPAGDIAPGMLADLVAVDLEHPSLHPRARLLKNVVYAMSHQAVTDVWVHGRPVVRGQRLATLDQAGLRERVRALTHDWKPA